MNGTTITLEDADEFYEFECSYIKLETHDVIYAEGVACESLLKVDRRQKFDVIRDSLEERGFALRGQKSFAS